MAGGVMVGGRMAGGRGVVGGVMAGGWMAGGWKAGGWKAGGWKAGGWMAGGWKAGGWKAGGRGVGGWMVGGGGEFREVDGPDPDPDCALASWTAVCATDKAMLSAADTAVRRYIMMSPTAPRWYHRVVQLSEQSPKREPAL
ncbi:MAG: hypothetical protein ACT6XY_07445 [Phreatobacter sp.]|uniref:hypothetical protein n=1 Tax=Phreatobacter sp. TaxID=1966341 RepID=UPI00403557C6